MSAPTIANDGPWTLGVKIGLPLAALCFIVLCGIAAFVVRKFLTFDEWHNSYSVLENRASVGAWAAGFTLLPMMFAALMLLAYWPLDSAYHQYREVHGKVRVITSRLLSAGDNGGTDQKFVVVFDGSPQQFAINDSRAALVHRGDVITIACIRTFQYGSTDGYDCNWGTP